MNYLENLNDYKFEDDHIVNFYWSPLNIITDKLIERYKNCKKVLEIGPGTVPFPLSTNSIGINEKIKDYIEVDIDTTIFPFKIHEFDFMYCRHVLEDIQNPDFAISEIFRTCKSGYIETPSPLIEITKGVDSGRNGVDYCGYIHHRYIIWSYKNTVYFLPKYPIIEYLIPNKQLISIANNYPIYWNNYLLFSNPCSIVIYKNGINMEIRTDYINLINRAVLESFLTTNEFFHNLSLI